MSSTASNVKSAPASSIFSQTQPSIKDVKCIRVDFLELQLKECQAREIASKQVADSIIQAIDPIETSCSHQPNTQTITTPYLSPLEILEDQHKLHVDSIKETFATQLRRVKAEFDALQIDHTLLKTSFTSLEKSKDSLTEKLTAETIQLKAENEFLASKIKLLESQVNLFQNSETQQNLKIEQLISDKVASASRIEALNSQVKIDAIIYQFKLEKERFVKEQQEQFASTQQEKNSLISKLSIQEILREKFEKELEEVKAIAQSRQTQLLYFQDEIQYLKNEKHLLLKDLASLKELPAIVRNLEQQLLAAHSNNESNNVSQARYQKLEQKYIESQQEASQAKCEAKIATMHSKLQADDWRRGIKKERKKSADLAIKFSSTQNDFSKKASTIVSQILIQDSTIKTLTKRLSQTQLNKSNGFTANTCTNSQVTDASQTLLPSQILDRYARPIFIESDRILTTESEIIQGNKSIYLSKFITRSPDAHFKEDKLSESKNFDDQERKPFADKLHHLISNASKISSGTSQRNAIKRVNSSMSLRGKSKGKQNNESFDYKKFR